VDITCDEPNPLGQQAHYLALAAKFRERAARSPLSDLSAIYLRLAEGYEKLAKGHAEADPT